MTATEFPTVEALVTLMKTEIIELIKDGTIPETVATFSELHDYIDANMLAEDLFPVAPDMYDDAATETYYDRLMDAINPAQNAVNEWLGAGRPE